MDLHARSASRSDAKVKTFIVWNNEKKKYLLACLALFRFSYISLHQYVNSISAMQENEARMFVQYRKMVFVFVEQSEEGVERKVACFFIRTCGYHG